MYSEELLAFIKQKQAEGASREEISNILITEGGWSKSDVDGAFASLDGGYTAVPAGQAAASAGAAPSQGGSNVPKVLMIGASVVVLAVGGFFGVRYFAQAQMPTTPKTLALHLAENLDKLERGRYQVTTLVKSEDMEEGFPRIDLTDPNAAERREKFERDKGTAELWRDISTELSSYMWEHNSYPASLEDLEIDTTDVFFRDYEEIDLSQFDYEQTDGGQGYSATIFFELESSARAQESSLREGVVIDAENRSVTVDEEVGRLLGLYQEPMPLVLSGFDSLNSMALIVPGLFETNLEVSGVFQEGERVPEVDSSASVEVTYGDMSFAAAGALRSKDEVMYGKVDRMPAIPLLGLDISPIRSEWVEITKEDLALLGSGASFLPVVSAGEGTEEEEQLLEAAKEVGKMVLQIALEEEVVRFQEKPSRTSFDGRSAQLYSFEVNADAVAPAYVRIQEEVNSYIDELVAEGVIPEDDPLAEGVTLDEYSLEYIDTQEFKNLVNYVNEHGDLELWLDVNTGMPIRAVSSFTYAPEIPEEEAGGLGLGMFFGGQMNTDSKVTYTVDVALSDINESLLVEVPEETIPFSEAFQRLSGVSEVEYNLMMQTQKIDSLRNGLSVYYDMTGSYPEALSELTQTASELAPEKPEDVSEWTYEQYKEAPLVENIPTDTYTGEPFGYKLVGDSYELTYTIEFPGYEGSVSNSLIGPSYAFGGDMTAELTYVDGENTATPELESIEASEENKLDSDGNGVPDYIDEYIGRDADSEVYEW